VRIRRARITDAAAVDALLAHSHEAKPLPFHGKVTTRGLAPFLRGDWAFFIAEHGGAAVGFVLVQRRARLGYTRREAWLANMVVLETYRRRGIGRLLVDAAERQARRWGCGTIRLESRAHRTEAHAFYRALGFDDHGVSFEKVLEPGSPGRVRGS